MLVNSLLKKYFKNQPDGIPGNDDTGTMSAWAVFSMMGLYPDCPGIPRYTLVAPAFDKIILHLDPRYYTQDTLVIECERPSPKAIYTDRITVNGKKHKGRFSQCRYNQVHSYREKINSIFLHNAEAEPISSNGNWLRLFYKFRNLSTIPTR